MPSSTASPPCIISSSRTRPRASWRSSPPVSWSRSAPRARSRPGWCAGWRSRSGRASAPSGSRSPCSSRPQAAPALARLRVGGGQPPHHLRPEALQRRARLSGPAGPRASRCLKDLRHLRREPLTECTGEPETASPNESGSPPPAANDDVSIARAPANSLSGKPLPGKPDRAHSGELPEPTRAELDRLPAADDRPGPAPAGLAWPAVLGRAPFRQAAGAPVPAGAPENLPLAG